MELRYKREVAVGGLLIVGTLAFIILMMWLKGKSFRSSVLVPVTFEDVMGLKQGDPVRTSGVRVGAVRKIELKSPGNVLVTLDVLDGPPPKDDAKVRILSQDLFGARYIEYFPGVSGRALPHDSMLRGERAQDMSEMAEGLANRSRSLLDSASAMTTMVSRELRVTLRNTQTLLGTLDRGANTSTTRLVGALEDLRSAIHRVDLLVAQNAAPATEMIGSMRNTSARADTMMRSLQRTSAQFDSVLAKVNSGRGPAAALLNDSTVVQNLMQTNAALRDLLTDFRANPGRYIRLRLF
jgi:phospholipid/cholesterol/gamma-HCH transport system substrate-binding protein